MYTQLQVQHLILILVFAVQISFDFQWKTWDDLCGSDHYPITISYGTRETSTAVPSWKLGKADW